MGKVTYQQALNQALVQEMERDERVVIMGEDIAGGSGVARGDGRLGRSSRGDQGTLESVR